MRGMDRAVGWIWHNDNLNSHPDDEEAMPTKLTFPKTDLATPIKLPQHQPIAYGVFLFICKHPVGEGSEKVQKASKPLDHKNFEDETDPTSIESSKKQLNGQAAAPEVPTLDSQSPSGKGAAEVTGRPQGPTVHCPAPFADRAQSNPPSVRDAASVKPTIDTQAGAGKGAVEGATPAHYPAPLPNPTNGQEEDAETLSAAAPLSPTPQTDCNPDIEWPSPISVQPEDFDDESLGFLLEEWNRELAEEAKHMAPYNPGREITGPLTSFLAYGSVRHHWQVFTSMAHKLLSYLGFTKEEADPTYLYDWLHEVHYNTTSPEEVPESSAPRGQLEEDQAVMDEVRSKASTVEIGFEGVLAKMAAPLCTGEDFLNADNVTHPEVVVAYVAAVVPEEAVAECCPATALDSESTLTYAVAEGMGKRKRRYPQVLSDYAVDVPNLPELYDSDDDEGCPKTDRSTAGPRLKETHAYETTTTEHTPDVLSLIHI